ELIGVLKFRMKISRTDSTAAAERRAGQSAGEAGILRHSFEASGRRCAERFLFRSGARTGPRDTKLVDGARAEDLGPAVNQSGRGHLLPSPGRGRRAVGDATEIARDEPEAIRVNETRKHVVA